MINLSKKAKEDLRETLSKEVGLDVANNFSEDELNRIGNLFLSITIEYLKMNVDN